MQSFNSSFCSVIFREQNALKHSKAINSLLFMNDLSFYSGARDSIVKLWSIDDNKNCLGLISNYDCHYNWITDLSLSLPKSSLFASSNDLSISQWNISTHSLTSKIPQAHKDYITALHYNNIKEYLYSSGLDGILYEINLDKGKPTSYICGTNQRSIYSFDASKDGNEFLVSSYDNSLSLYDGRAKRNQIIRELKGHEGLIRKVRLSEDSTRAMTISNDSTVRLWDVAEGRELYMFKFNSPVMALYVNDSFTLGVTGSKDGEVYLIDLKHCVYTKVDQFNEGISSIAMNSSESKLVISTQSHLYHYQLKKEPKAKVKEAEATPLIGSIQFTIEDKHRQSAVLIGEEMVDCSILKNKLYAIAKYRDNSIALFNLFNMKQIYHSSSFPYEELKDKLNKIAGVNKLKTWCSVDIKLGCLTMEIPEKTAFANKPPTDTEIIEKYIENDFNDLKVELDLVVIDKGQVETEPNISSRMSKAKKKEKEKASQQKSQILQMHKVITEPNVKDEASLCSMLFSRIVLCHVYWHVYRIVSQHLSTENAHKLTVDYLSQYKSASLTLGSEAEETVKNNCEYQYAFFDNDNIKDNSIQLVYINKDKAKDAKLITFPKFLFNKYTFAPYKDLLSLDIADVPKVTISIIIDKTDFKVLDNDQERDKIEQLLIPSSGTLLKLYTFLISKFNQESFRKYVINDIEHSNLTQNQKNFIEKIFLNDNTLFIELKYGELALRPSKIKVKLLKLLLSKEKELTFKLTHVSIEELIKRGAIAFDA